MKTNLCILLFVIASLFTTAQAQNNDDCSIVKNGKFKYLDIEDTTAYFTIENNKHQEFHKSNAYYIKSDLKWVGDCQYTMKMKECTIPDFPYKAGDVMKVTINKIEGNIIYYTSEVKGVSWNGRLLKIE